MHHVINRWQAPRLGLASNQKRCLKNLASETWFWHGFTLQSSSKEFRIPPKKPAVTRKTSFGIASCMILLQPTQPSSRMIICILLTYSHEKYWKTRLKWPVYSWFMMIYIDLPLRNGRSVQFATLNQWILARCSEPEPRRLRIERSSQAPRHKSHQNHPPEIGPYRRWWCHGLEWLQIVWMTWDIYIYI